MNTKDSLTTTRPGRNRAAAARTRDRAAALFADPPTPSRDRAGAVGEAPDTTWGSPEAGRGRPGDEQGMPDREAGPPGPPPPPPTVTVPGVPVFSTGRVGRLRAWLYVRCGLEIKTVLALAVVLAVAGGLAFQHYWSGRPRTVPVPPPVTALPQAPRATPSPESRLTVDVAGKVSHPGLRHLAKGARVADALAAAGGPLPGTDTTTLNLARLLTDGEQLLVGLPPPAAAASQGTTSDPATPTSPLSLNSATAAQLDALPGVGPILAQHILDFRAQHGGFTSLRQLRQVPGIGERKFTTLKPLVHP